MQRFLHRNGILFKNRKQGEIMEKVVILYFKGEKWLEGKPHWEQGLSPHRDYLIEKLKDGLLTAGQYLDHTGGLVIANVESVAEAEHIVQNDPAVIDQILTYEVHPWEPLLGNLIE